MYRDRFYGFSLDSHNGSNNTTGNILIYSLNTGWKIEARIFSLTSFSKFDSTTSMKSFIIGPYIGVPIRIEKYVVYRYIHG